MKPRGPSGPKREGDKILLGFVYIPEEKDRVRAKRELHPSDTQRFIRTVGGGGKGGGSKARVKRYRLSVGKGADERYGTWGGGQGFTRPEIETKHKSRGEKRIFGPGTVNQTRRIP